MLALVIVRALVEATGAAVHLAAVAIVLEIGALVAPAEIGVVVLGVALVVSVAQARVQAAAEALPAWEVLVEEVVAAAAAVVVAVAAAAAAAAVEVAVGGDEL